jgi:hypothetical protein
MPSNYNIFSIDRRLSFKDLFTMKMDAWLRKLPALRLTCGFIIFYKHFCQKITQ